MFTKFLYLCILSFLVFGCGGGSDSGISTQGQISGQSSQVPLGPPSQLGFLTVPSRAAGATLTSAVVEIQDDQGRRVADSPRTISLAIVQSPVTLIGTVAAESLDGLATFPDLQINTTGSYLIKASSPGLKDAFLSRNLEITPSAPVSINVSTLDLSSVPAGKPLDPTLQVGLFDAFGNLATDFTGSASIQVTAGPVDGLTGGTVVFQNGIATFSDLVFTKVAKFNLRLEISGLPQLTQTLPEATVFSRGDLLVSRGLSSVIYDSTTCMFGNLVVTPPTIPLGTTLRGAATHSGESVYQSSVGHLIGFAIDPATGVASNGSELPVLTSIGDIAVDLTDQTLVAGYGTSYDLRAFNIGSQGTLSDSEITANHDGRPRTLEFVEVNGQQVLVMGITNGTNVNFLALPYDPAKADPFGVPGQGIYVGTGSFKHGSELVSGQFNGQTILYGGTNQNNGPCAVQAFTTDASGNLTKQGPQFDVARFVFVDALALASNGTERVLMVGAGQELVQYSLTADGALNAEIGRLNLGSFVESLDVNRTGTKLFVSLGAFGRASFLTEIRDLTQANWPVTDSVRNAAQDSLLFLRDPARD